MRESRARAQSLSVRLPLPWPLSSSNTAIPEDETRARQLGLFVTSRFGEREAVGWRFRDGCIDMEPKKVINNGSVEILTD